MGRFRVAVAVAVAALLCAGGASAVRAATRAATQELTITASDGTKLACGLVLPAGSPPTGGWPGVMLFHGLGQTHAAMETIANVALAPTGFASLMCDARGTGGSGGTFGLDGPKEVQDARDLFAWFAARADVSNTQIGAFGLSLGGGAVWNAAVAGVPFKAIVPAITWTSLGTALNPAGVPKTGEVQTLAQVVSASSWEPALAVARIDLATGVVTPAVKSAEAARSSRPKLRSLHVPTLLLQGRHDFLFDLDQAVAAYGLLAGPKRLYLGDLGHPPAANPAAELPTYLGEAVAWFAHYLAGRGAVHGGVELAHDPWDGSTTSYTALPRTRHVSVNLPGSKRIAAGSSVSRSVRLTGGPLETFGDGSVSVRYARNSVLTEIRAMVSVKGGAAPVTVGAAKIGGGSGVVKIPLLDEAVLLPRGRRLTVVVGGTTADGVYEPLGSGGAPAITIGRITLNLSLLRKPVSR
ncbi:MAG TPA: CocE/NonD family hydrolase [Gaiellaceae bacterium]|nr:CocE/NonD family hydrolase [Gaiellaceae bacterium]